MSSFPKVYAQEIEPAPIGPDGEGTPSSSPFQSMLPMIVIFFAIMYFLIIRPNQKREKERKNLLASLSKGDDVVTSGGVCGTITGLSEKIVTLQVCTHPETKIEFLRGAVTQVAARADDKDKS